MHLSGVEVSRDHAEIVSVDGRHVIRAAVAALLAQAPERVLNRLLDAVRTFTRGAVQSNDIAAVVIKYGG